MDPSPRNLDATYRFGGTRVADREIWKDLLCCPSAARPVVACVSSPARLVATVPVTTSEGGCSGVGGRTFCIFSRLRANGKMKNGAVVTRDGARGRSRSKESKAQSHLVLGLHFGTRRSLKLCTLNNSEPGWMCVWSTSRGVELERFELLIGYSRLRHKIRRA